MDARDAEAYDVTLPYLPDFAGFFEMCITFPDATNHADFVVNEARYIDPSKGGKNIAGAFKDAQFKRPILNNLLNAIEKKDVAKLREILDALSVVGA